MAILLLLHLLTSFWFSFMPAQNALPIIPFFNIEQISLSVMEEDPVRVFLDCFAVSGLLTLCCSCCFELGT